MARPPRACSRSNDQTTIALELVLVIRAAITMVLCLLASSCAATTTGTPSASPGPTVMTSPPTEPSASASARREPAPTRSPEVRTATAAQVPPTFVAIAGSISDGIVLVDTATGRILRSLAHGPPGGGPSDLTMSEDRSVVFFTRGDGTGAAHLAVVALAGGDERGLSRRTRRDCLEANPAVSSDSRKIAFRRGCRQGQDQGGLVIAHLGPDGVREPERVHPGARGSPLAWSRDGRLLLVSDPESSVWEVDDAGSVTARYAIRSPTSGCELFLFGFEPVSGGLLGGQRCGPFGPDLQSSYLLLDPRTGAVRRKLLDAPRGYQLLRATFDRSGRHLLYSRVKSNPHGCVTPSRECPVQPHKLYRFSEGESVEIPGDSAFEQTVW